MKIPKYIDEALRKRTSCACKLLTYDENSEGNRDMTMLKIPLTESVWGNIQTSKDNHFIITSDVASSKYYLYIKQRQEYNRLSSSKQPYKLLQDIQNYEKRNML